MWPFHKKVKQWCVCVACHHLIYGKIDPHALYVYCKCSRCGHEGHWNTVCDMPKKP